MKKYLLLASVAGCLLNAGNALAEVTYYYEGEESAPVNVSVVLDTGFVWGVQDVNFGSIVLSGTAANNDIIATFTDGTLSFTEGKVMKHSGEETGLIELSAGAMNVVTGVSFSPTTIDLTDSESNVVAQMTNIGPSDRDGMVYYINGQLVLKDRSIISGGAFGANLTGTTTATLAF